MADHNERPLDWEANVQLATRLPREPFQRSAATFLQQVHPDPDGFLELRAFGPGQTPITTFVALPFDDGALARIRDFARQHRQTRNVYHALATRATSQNGTLANCSRLHALYIEIDLKRGVPLRDLWKRLTANHPYRTNDEALAHGVLLPSAIVHSGGGLHVYWLLSEPLDLTVDLDVERAYRWLGDLALQFGGEPESAEPARVLRVPDTINHKDGYGAPFVTLLTYDWRRRYTRRHIIASLGDVDPTRSAVSLVATETVDHHLDDAARVRIAREWLTHRVPAVEGQGGDKHTFGIACAVAIGHDLGEDDALDAMKDWNARCTPPWSKPELRRKIQNAIRYGKGPRGSKLFVKDKTGKIVPNNQRNIRVALDDLGVDLRYNEFTAKTEVRWRGRHETLEDAIRNDIWLAIDEDIKFRPSADFFDIVLNHTARQQTFHPVRDYLDGLRWDGQPRIDRWLVDYAGSEDTEFTRAVSRLFLVAAVRRVRHPGCKFDELLVLKSAQGTEKSTAMRTLCPDADWFSDDLPLNVDSKQMIERTTGKWIIEASDLHGYGKREEEHLKASLSRQVDGPARMACARLAIERPRHFLLVGTTNLDEFLGKDKTGSRRFWPVVIRRFRIDALKADRDQLWAEAAAAEHTGESIRLDKSLWPAAGERQAEHTVEDEWLVLLRDKLGFPAKPEDRVLLEKPWEILGILAKDRDDRMATRMSQVMQALGYERKQARGLFQDNRSAKRWCLKNVQ